VLELSVDGVCLAVGVRQELHLFDVRALLADPANSKAQAESKLVLAEDAEIIQAAWAPADTPAAGRIVVATSEGALYAARVTPGTAEVAGPVTKLSDAMVGAAAWSPDGAQLAFATDEGTVVTAVTAADGQCVASARLPEGTVADAVRWASDEQLLLGVRREVTVFDAADDDVRCRCRVLSGLWSLAVCSWAT
jgi:hypothetical protein